LAKRKSENTYSYVKHNKGEEGDAWQYTYGTSRSSNEFGNVGRKGGVRKKLLRKKETASRQVRTDRGAKERKG